MHHHVALERPQRHRAALPLHQRHGARPRRLRRRRAVRGARRALQGADRDAASSSTSWAARRPARRWSAPSPWASTPTTSTAARTTSSSPTAPCSATRWPRYSACSTTATTTTQLSRYFGGINIEDLWIPYFAVSTNLSRYELHRHDRGDLFDAIRASGSIPVLLPPVYTPEGEMLVDGCLLDNVPIRTMHAAEKRAQRRRQLPHPGAGALRRRLQQAALARRADRA